MTYENDQESEGPIELTENFVVTYNCHTDEFIINGGVQSGWKRYANQPGNFKRSVTEKNSKVKSRIVKTKRSPQKISWTFSLDKLPEASRFLQDSDSKVASQKFFVFVNSSTKGKGDVLWTLTRGKFDTQLSPRIINEVQLGKLTKTSDENHDKDLGQGNGRIGLSLK